MEEFDRVFVNLNNKVTEDEKKLVTAKKLTTDDVENYIQSNKPMSTDIYKFLAADGTLKKYIKFCSWQVCSFHLQRQMFNRVFPS